MTGIKASKHIVACLFAFWGHTKPMCALLAKLVRVEHVYATILADEIMYARISKEIDKRFDLSKEQHLRNLIRIVSLNGGKPPFDLDTIQGEFIEKYKILYSGEPVPVSPSSDEKFEAIIPPQLVLLDMFGYKTLKGIRSISGGNVPIYAWQTAAAVAVLYMFGPEHLGGNGDLVEKLEKIEAEDEETRDKEIVKIYRRDSGKLLNIPGLPPMYDHELTPQIMAFERNEAELAKSLQTIYRFVEESDGIIHSTSHHYEGGALEGWREWIKDKPIYAIGPISPPPTLEEVKAEVASNPISSEVEEFLNRAHDTHGPNSVLYMSFGTVWWSKEPEKIWAVVDTLIEKGIPFLFSHASPMAIIPEEVTAKVKASGLGLMATWLPQQMIFRHKACGWFLSHGGHNSVMESLTAGIPMILWPFDADQPGNAANVSVIHNAGYELYEVRNGLGLRPLHRLGDKAPEGTVEAVRREIREVLDKARGEDGKIKRENAQKISVKFSEMWDSENGSGWKDLKKIVEGL
ncbi:UDP-Glycosyltransferase glycogen phosphorylase [Pyrrhoderma noxium]|uniref:UDP-Glycosyltransferase glycogen phosphorylase n=1 Tax=Pyrrhoderma noxium TaxID=2282107 RepID=A0A286UJB7_9AGAM|nr:UDP-Glycosyltransferase glycogen phosphorylase [Pyrrhoderma noxium]